MKKHIWTALIVTSFAIYASAPAATRNLPTIQIWPHGAPGPSGATGPERDMTKPADNLVAGKPLIRLGNITDPTITVYKPPKDKNTGAAVVVFPGGGYRILAMNLEGSEVCDWLNSIGVTGVLLKYRVPEPDGLPRYAEPLEDAQRTVGLIRYRAKEWGIDPARVGVLGFSAGGHLAAAISNNFEKRTYSPVDAADKLSCRPNFAILIYPAYLTVDEGGRELSPELHVTANTPPTFLVQTEDDPVHVENSLIYFRALKNARVPAEMHLYSTGGHGYGLRRTNNSVTTWPRRANEWLRSLSVLRTGK